jgi:hypothetical protein
MLLPTLNNLNYPVNSSPVFANIPVTQFCVGNQFYYNRVQLMLTAISLVYSLVDALDNDWCAFTIRYQD